MNASIKAPSLIVLLTAVVLPFSASADTFVREEVRVFNPEDFNKISVSTGSGDVNVSNANVEEIRVEIILSAKALNEKKADKAFDKVKIRTEEKGRTLDLSVENTSSGFSWFGLGDAHVQAVVTVVSPPGMSFSVDTGSGDIRLENITGEVTADTGSGDIIGQSIVGTVSTDTGSGDVELSSVTGAVQADTGSGDIRLDGIQGAVDADTGSGNVSVTRIQGPVSAGTGSGNVSAEGEIPSFSTATGSGNIRITTKTALAESSKAATGSGEVTISVPASSHLELDAHANSGRISCTLPMLSSETTDDSLKAVVNGPGPVLKIRTGSGNIRVH